MQISIEWFLLDNLLMNWLILRLASALCGLPMRKHLRILMPLFGAVYALASVIWLPILSLPLPKLLLGCIMALPLVYHRSDIVRAILFLYLAACLIGGLMLCLCMVLGGSLLQGALIGTLPLRAALIGGVLSALLPRVFRILKEHIDQRALYVPLRIRYAGQTIQMSALIDSGNLLIEPMSAKPVIIIRQGLLSVPVKEGRPVVYQSIGGSGVLLASEAERIGIFRKRWHTIDACFAESSALLGDADAILPATLMPIERTEHHAETTKGEIVSAVLQSVFHSSAAADTIHSLGGDAASTVSAGRGTGVDQTLDDGRTGSEECAD